ncbi:class I SAM-dependent methyltransferase [Aeromonas eucrenophila]|uniref:Class I SAM-dependent methyltransferase n=1 Tax=Aeromonas eucrenophila TaxID=649 RepID=A0ABW0YAP5_9GAMM|nr:class I SAM-dependent methyltransferase [Aeromonas eucrenophila]
MPASTPSPDNQRPACTGEAHAPFLTRLRTGAHLLEAGCGTGEDLHYFRELGYMVTAFDASREQASAASRLCGQPVRVCHFNQMHSVVPFDGIWASASLPCLHEQELAPVLTHLASLLKPGAPLYCSFPHLDGAQSTGSPEGDYPLRVCLDEAGLRALLAPLPFEPLRLWCAEDGVNGRWLHALLLRQP